MKSGRFGVDDLPVFVIDQSRCIGCEACVQACMECGTHRGQSLIHLERIDRAASTQTAPMVCMHCEDPTCAEVCPADAIKQNEDGGSDFFRMAFWSAVTSGNIGRTWQARRSSTQLPEIMSAPVGTPSASARPSSPGRKSSSSGCRAATIPSSTKVPRTFRADSVSAWRSPAR